MSINRQRVRRLMRRLQDHEGPTLVMDGYLMNLDKYGRNNSILREGIVDSILRRASEDNWCGTQACIAGHAAIMAVAEGVHCDLGSNSHMPTVAAHYLGLTAQQSYDTFMQWDDKGSVEEAVAKLQRLLDEDPASPANTLRRFANVAGAWLRGVPGS